MGADVSRTLRVGDSAPEFALAAANRFDAPKQPQRFSLRQLMAHGPVILEFLRGTWLPNCVKRMAQFEPVRAAIESAGVQIAFIAAEKRAGMFNPEKFLLEHPISFPFLLDEDRQVTKAYGVYHRLGRDAINIARPATFVVDRSGLLRFIYVGASQTDRAAIETVVGAAKSIS